MNNQIGFFDITVWYIKGDKCIFKDYVFKAKKDTLAHCPPEFPIKDNEFWIIDWTLYKDLDNVKGYLKFE